MKYITTIKATEQRFDDLFRKGELSRDFLAAARATKSFQLTRDNGTVKMTADNQDWESLIGQHLVGDDISFVFSECRKNVDVSFEWRGWLNKAADQTVGRLFNHIIASRGGVVTPVTSIERMEPTGDHYPVDGKPYTIRCELYYP